MEMNQRGGPPFLHIGFASHQYAIKGKNHINNTLRFDMRLYGGEDRALRAMWSRAPPLSAPLQITEQGWSMWQLYSFDGHTDHAPHILPPIHPATWAGWYWDNYKQHSTAWWNYESSQCPPDIYAEYLSLYLQEEQAPTEDSAQDSWSVAS